MDEGNEENEGEEVEEGAGAKLNEENGEDKVEAEADKVKEVNENLEEVKEEKGSVKDRKGSKKRSKRKPISGERTKTRKSMWKRKRRCLKPLCLLQLNVLYVKGNL